MAQGGQSAEGRPLSPHVQVWRWHITMLASILHRVAGIGLYIGLLILAIWLLGVSRGPAQFSALAAALWSPAGLAVLMLILAAWLFHLANGVRHLFWDVGKGFGLPTANATAWIALVFSVLGTAAIVAGLLSRGKI